MKHNIATTTQNAQRNIQESAGNNPNLDCSKSTENLMDIEALPGTPFHLVGQGNQYFLVMGDHRITEPTNTEEETLDKLEKDKWMIIFTVAAVILEKMSGMKIKEIRDGYTGVEDLTDKHPMHYGAKPDKVERAIHGDYDKNITTIRFKTQEERDKETE